MYLFIMHRHKLDCEYRDLNEITIGTHTRTPLRLKKDFTEHMFELAINERLNSIK